MKLLFLVVFIYQTKINHVKWILSYFYCNMKNVLVNDECNILSTKEYQRMIIKRMGYGGNFSSVLTITDSIQKPNRFQQNHTSKYRNVSLLFPRTIFWMNWMENRQDMCPIHIVFCKWTIQQHEKNRLFYVNIYY